MEQQYLRKIIVVPQYGTPFLYLCIVNQLNVIIMATKVLSNEFMQNIATEEAWKELSSNFAWTGTMLEKYQDKVNWDEISKNRNIRWTIPLIQKFQKKINWDKFSDYTDENILTEGTIEAFKDKWNWHNLSNNGNVPLADELLEKYADRWDWEQIIDCYGCSCYDKRAIEFYEKFKEYIPASKLQNTYLWRGIVEQRARQLMAEIIG